MTDDASNGSAERSGAGGRLKAALSKATAAVTSIVKKDGAKEGGNDFATPDVAEKKSERTSKMKDAVEAARKAQDDD